MVRVPVRIPAVVGEKTTVMKQNPLGCSVPVQPFWLMEKSPFTEADEMVSAEFPPFVKFSPTAAPTVLTSKSPKLKLPVDGLSRGATPWPKSWITWFGICASSVSVKVAPRLELSIGV